MNPFYEKLIWTVLGMTLIALPYLVPQLAPVADVFKISGGTVFGGAWIHSPDHRALKRAARASSPPVKP
jgi:hypothetical protein